MQTNKKYEINSNKAFYCHGTWSGGGDEKKTRITESTVFEAA